jgi:hypothetical protein
MGLAAWVRSSWVLVALLLVSCRDEAPSPQRPDGAVSTTGSASARARPSGSADAQARSATAARRPPDALPSALLRGSDETPRLEAPAEPACVFETRSWQPPNGYRALLRIHPKAEPFALLHGGPVRLVIPAGVGYGVVELDRGALRLTALVRADTTPERLPWAQRPAARRPMVLRAARAVVLAGVVAVGADTLVGWRAARPGALAVTLPATTVEFEPGVAADVPCRDLSLDVGSFDHRALLPEVPADGPQWRLVLGRAVRLAAAAEGKPSVSVRPWGGLVHAVEIARSERRVRIVVELPEVALFGWVKPRDLMGDALAPLLTPPGLALDVPLDGGWGSLRPGPVERLECRCPQGVPVILAMAPHAGPSLPLEQRYAVVAQLRPSQPFRVRTEPGELWELDLEPPLAGLTFTRGRLMVHRHDLESCRRHRLP